MTELLNEEDWREKFKHYDKNQDGVISASELGRLLQYLGFCPTDKELEHYMQQLDKNHDDKIDFEEFFEFLKTLKDPTDEIRRAFQKLDKNKDGFIDKEELKAIFTSGNTDPNEVDDLFKHVDVNQDGRIDYEEFVELFTEPCIVKDV